MKFYLDSAQDWEPYDDLKTNKLMQKYVREIKEVAGVKVTIEKGTAVYEDCQHIVVDIPSSEALVQIMKATGKDLVIQQQYDKNDKYARIKIYDDYIE